MTSIYLPPLIEHIFHFGICGVGRAVGIDVGAKVGEEVGAGADVGEGLFKTNELAAVVKKNFAVAGEAVFF